MPINTTPFTLHPGSEHFVPGESALEFAEFKRYPYQMNCFDSFLALLFIPVVPLCVILMVVAGVNGIADEVSFWREGRETTGHVTSCHEDNSFRSPKIVLYYVYLVGADEYRGQATFDGSNCRLYRVDTPVPVFYKTSNPAEVRIVDHGVGASIALRIGGYSLVLLAAAFIPILILRIIRHHRQAKQAYERLCTQAVVLEGRITRISVEDVYEAKTIVTYVMIGYQFESPQKTVIKGFNKVRQWDLEQLHKSLTKRDKRKRDSESQYKDLTRATLPPIWTRVKVLYADDQTHIVL